MNTAGTPAPWHRLALRATLALAAAALALPACQWEVPDDPFIDSGLDAPPGDGGSDAATDAPTDGMPMVTLTILRSGSATGTVTSNAVGGAMIDCGTTCSASFPPGTLVTLTEIPGTGAVFAGWAGVCSDAAPSCSFTLDSDTTVQATFDVSRHTVTIIPGGNGLGAVTSNVGGLACPGTCETVVDYGTTLTLTASPTPPSVFAGWNDVACTGTGACTFTVTQDEVIDAAFALNYTVTVAKNGNGNGTVTSSPAGITCGADCDQVYPAGTMVTLTAAAAADSTFAGWSGACTGTGTCTVQVNAVVAVTATFSLRRYTLTTSKAGSTGDGVVTSNPAGITCGGDCEELYDHGTQVTLTATPDASSTFTGWSEATCPGTSACVVTMTGARSVGATFTINRYPLTVVKAGNGAGLGTVTSAPAGITCGADCDELYAAGTMVTLSASAMPGATFTGWSGACTGAGPCVVTMTGAQSVTATFALGQYALSVSKAGNGASLGTVTSSPAGISCGSTCSAGFQFGQSVTLTPTAASGATFAGWSGGGCSGVGTCVVTIGGDTSVTATFTLESYTLSVVREGNAAAAGLVTSAPSGITCDAATGDCDHTYLFGTSVTLTATAGSGSTFAGWSGGGCAGTGPCAVTIDAARTVTATFTLDEALTVTRLGSGAPYGRVVSSPAGIDCGNDCSENFGVGTMVNLTASATAGAATFTGWGGACSGTQPTCAVTVAAATGVTATFTRVSYTLTAALAGDGSGTIESSPAGITCGTDCAESYGYATSVTLTATPDAGSTFTGWSGGGCSGTAACVVSVTAATTVTATFQADRVLTVSTSGNGAGTVTSAPGGISCPGDCAEAYTHGSTVRLTATPTTGSTFTGWSGGGCSGTGACDVSMTAARSVQATFALTTHTLTVNRAGTGAGTITSTPAGIACGADCTETVTFGATLTLAAAAATGSTFTGWSGGGCSGTDTCVVTVTAATTVTATFEADRTLQVTRAGTGAAYGRVTSSPGGVDCGASCSQAYPYGSLVTLTASVPIAAAATFAGWSGGGCSGAQATCTVPMNQAQSVTATFTIRQHTISVSVGGGNGSGTVSSTPAGINAPADPAEAYPYGTTVTLAATAATGSNFTGWSGVGGCAGVGPCDVLVDGARTVTATFTLQQFTLGVTKTGTSTSLGTVTSSPAGVACGSTCSAQFDYDQAVTLTAATMPGVTFLGWSGAGCSGTGACGVTMTQARSVSAAFEGDKTLTVSLGGSGAGTVVSSPPGIMAPGDASEAYAHGTVVTLTAAANTTTSTFTGWSGACTGAQATCDVTMDQARSVTATFTLRTYTLTVDKAGAGVGTVASNPGGINCGTACATQNATFSHGQSVSLSHTAGADSEFVAWGGACTGATCSVTMTQDRTVSANFKRTDKTLTVTVSGTGTGTVTSVPAGINAPTDGSETYAHGTSVTLTANPNMTTSDFDGWTSGPCMGSTALTCAVTMDQARTVNAAFRVKTYTLTLNKLGAGTGTVTSTPAGLTCGTACTTQNATFTHGQSVSLSHAAGADSEFVAWGGACTGATCSVTMTQDRTVTANFKRTDKTLTVTVSGSGTGTVTSVPAGINAPTDGSETYAHGTSVTLTANPTAATSDFDGWTSGPCMGSTALTCAVTMDQARTVNAAFRIKKRTLTVVRAGFGSGTVQSTMPAGIISCGTDCSEDVDHGTSVTLTATPAAGDVFHGWSGGGCAGTGVCTTTVTAATTVTATFDQCDRTQAEICVEATEVYTQCSSSGQRLFQHACSMGCAVGVEKCLELEPSNDNGGSPEAGDLSTLLDMAASAPAIHCPTGAACTLNTNTGAMSGFQGTLPPTTNVAGVGRVVRGSTMTIAGTLKITGDAAPVFLSYGDVTISGLVDVSADFLTAGPGARSSAEACTGGLGSLGGANNTISAGGGGGGQWGWGANGGSTTAGFGGSGGSPLGDLDLVPLRGGCSGGQARQQSGVQGLLDYSFGGAGGGAIQIVSRTKITIAPAGVIDASGGGGQSGTTTFGGFIGGAGGGSGGGILLEAPMIELQATSALSTKGGGGAAAGDGQAAHHGRDGDFGGATSGAAPGGTSTGASGGAGGVETCQGSGAGCAVTGMGGGSSDSGGGGGSVGIARFNSRLPHTQNGAAVVRTKLFTGSPSTRLFPAP